MSLYDGNVHQELLVCGSAADGTCSLANHRHTHGETGLCCCPTARQCCVPPWRSGTSWRRRAQQQPWAGVVSQPGGCFISCLHPSETFDPAGSWGPLFHKRPLRQPLGQVQRAALISQSGYLFSAPVGRGYNSVSIALLWSIGHDLILYK